MHEWNMTVSEAIEVQKRLKDQVLLVPLPQPPSIIGGCDVSMNMFAKEGYAGFVNLAYPSLEPLDHAVAQGPITFPYIPGLLSFREIPILMKAWEKLATKPDVLVVDGVGIAHPRRLGIASHLGLMLDIPTIGCAKSVLTGVYDEPFFGQGAFTYLRDKKTTDIIGAAFRSKKNTNPIYISPGHKITLAESIEIVRSCLKGYRLPEPTRRAHDVVNEYRRRGSAD